MQLLLKVIIIFLPWKLKRILLIWCFGYKIDKTSRIGFSWIYPRRLILDSNATIGHLNVAIHLDEIKMGAFATIARSNWITGYTSRLGGKHFLHQLDRVSSLTIGEHSAITKNHHLDCTNTIIIGKFTTVAGYQSQLLTHSIDILEGRQNSNPICIGEYCFVGTNSVVLGGAVLPSFSVLGAKSLLNKAYQNEYFLYGGVPAKPISEILKNTKYFLRTAGFIY